MSPMSVQTPPAIRPMTNKEIRRARKRFGDNPPVLCMVGQSDCKVWGLTTTERLRRMVKVFGIVDIREEGDPLPTEGRVVLVRADYAIEDRVVNALIGRSFGTILMSGNEEGADDQTVPVAAHVDAADAAETVRVLVEGRLPDDEAVLSDVVVARPIEIGSAYSRKLRKREEPYVLQLNEGSIETIENRIFAGAYKGITDFITKYAWPLPARWVTRQAVRFGWTPNAVTMASLILVFVALVLFMQGYFLTGILVGFVMTFLDTVDGKLARVTLTSSRWGNTFDHSIDLIHPPFWYAAWCYGLFASGYADGMSYLLNAALWIVVGGYVIGRMEENYFNKLFGIQIHTWRPVDSFFRLITARRNPNITILLLAALAGRPDIGFLLIALWTIISIVFHGVRIIQAALLGEQRLRSWLMEPAQGLTDEDRSPAVIRGATG